MPTIDEANAASAPVVRTDADVIAGVAIAKAEADAVKARRDALRQELAAATAATKAARAAARAAAAAAPKLPTARDFVRALDAAILAFAGAEFDGMEIPEELRDEVGSLLSNQLHHLASAKTGWVGTLPVPNRSEWL
jgi:hypothetical protein